MCTRMCIYVLLTLLFSYCAPRAQVRCKHLINSLLHHITNKKSVFAYIFPTKWHIILSTNFSSSALSHKLVINWNFNILSTAQGHVSTIKLCHKQVHILKLFSYIYKSILKPIHKTNPYTNIKHTHTNIKHKVLKS